MARRFNRTTIFKQHTDCFVVAAAYYNDLHGLLHRQRDSRRRKNRQSFFLCIYFKTVLRKKLIFMKDTPS